MLVLSLCMVGCFSQSKDDAEKNEEKLTKAVAPFTVDNAITVFYKRTKWTTSTNIHYNAGNGWITFPGNAMNYDSASRLEKITLRATSLTFCFNSNNIWDNNFTKNYSITSPGTYKVENGVITKLGNCNVTLYFTGNHWPLGGQTVRVYKDYVLIQKSEIDTDIQGRAFATLSTLPVGANYKFVVSTWSSYREYASTIYQTINLSDAGKFLSFTGTVSETVSNFSYSGTSYPSVYPNMGYDVEIFYSNPKYCANPAKAYQSAANTMYIAYDNGTSWKEQVMDNSSSQSMWRIGEDGYNVARAYLSFNRVPWTKISFYIKDSNNVRDNNNSANYQITKPGKYLLINGYLLKI